ncbi:hypothetical protein [Buchnera aphidicola]|uniref:hypothetical protein n=1 Tax=Buchnera aphidicola TaxID=9 RepID=UPI00094C687D|nr:hypothetical protein [Buchnera aphidicola]
MLSKGSKTKKINFFLYGTRLQILNNISGILAYQKTAVVEKFFIIWMIHGEEKCLKKKWRSIPKKTLAA